jgi:hypothetical protein
MVWRSLLTFKVASKCQKLFCLFSYNFQLILTAYIVCPFNYLTKRRLLKGHRKCCTVPKSLYYYYTNTLLENDAFSCSDSPAILADWFEVTVRSVCDNFKPMKRKLAVISTSCYFFKHHKQPRISKTIEGLWDEPE